MATHAHIHNACCKSPWFFHCSPTIKFYPWANQAKACPYFCYALHCEGTVKHAPLVSIFVQRFRGIMAMFSPPTLATLQGLPCLNVSLFAMKDLRLSEDIIITAQSYCAAPFLNFFPHFCDSVAPKILKLRLSPVLGRTRWSLFQQMLLLWQN